jgi:hypothetical protein
MDRSVEEKYLGFREVKFHARSLTEKVDHCMNSERLMNCGDSHQKNVIHELTMRNGQIYSMGGES